MTPHQGNPEACATQACQLEPCKPQQHDQGYWSDKLQHSDLQELPATNWPRTTQRGAEELLVKLQRFTRPGIAYATKEPARDLTAPTEVHNSESSAAPTATSSAPNQEQQVERTPASPTSTSNACQVSTPTCLELQLRLAEDNTSYNTAKFSATCAGATPHRLPT